MGTMALSGAYRGADYVLRLAGRPALSAVQYQGGNLMSQAMITVRSTNAVSNPEEETMKVVTRTDILSHDEWLEARSKGLGGSDAGTILGTNPYKGRLELWLVAE